MSDKPAHPINSMLHILIDTADVTKDKAAEVAGSLLRMPGAGSAGQLTEQVAALADELMLVAATNRRLVFDAVRGELEGNLSRFGLATQAELSAATAETERLGAEVKRLRNALRGAGIEFADNADNRDYEILGYETESGSPVTPPATRPPRVRQKRATPAGESTAAAQGDTDKSAAKKAAAKKAPTRKSATSRTGGRR